MANSTVRIVQANWHMGVATSQYILQGDADMRDHHLNLYAALLGISFGRALARFNMRITGAL